LTFSLLYAFNERFLLPLSHDEVVHGKGSLLDKMPGDVWQKFANLRLLLTYMAVHPGKKLLFMGGEFGQWQEWRFHQSLDWHLLDRPEHKGVLDLVRDLNRLGVSEPALHRLDHSWEGFSWIDFHDIDASVISFLRKDGTGDDLLVACNFTPSLRKSYRIGAPRAGHYTELLSSDAAKYGGSGVCNSNGAAAVPEPLTVQNQPFSICVDLPPLGAAVFRVPR
jgi:1,4-alpha-glucan branching enzyme